jgi:glycosyltransferase involved in cell wall biosynthesis
VPPLVSILINNYNYGRFIRDAIDSALTQRFHDCEVVVVDDGSTDNSQAVIAGFGNRINSIFKSNGGQASAFNVGFENCRGNIICLLDSDDVFLPTKVAQVVCALETQNREWHCHQLQWTDGSLTPLDMPACNYRTGDYDLRSASRAGKVRLSPPSTSGLSFTRALLERIMPMPESITITSDNYIKYAALALAPGYCDTEQLALQRLHGSNAYTLKRDDSLKAAILLKTAVGLRAHFPCLRVACNRMYAEGLATRLRSGTQLAELYLDSRDYLLEATFMEKVAILSRFGFEATRFGIGSIVGNDQCA